MSALTATKAARYLLAGSVEITCAEGAVEATVRGDTGTWRLFREPDRWRCSCPAWRRCSHLEAVEKVTEP